MKRNPKRPMPRTEALRELALFQDASDEELRTIDRLMTPLRIEAGTRLTVEGSGGLDALVVAEGRAQVTKQGRPVAVIGPGGLIGELAVLLGSPRSATVTALTPMQVYVMHLGEFAEMLRIAPSVRAKVEGIALERAGAPMPKPGWSSGISFAT